jgi:hypothetical protein
MRSIASSNGEKRCSRRCADAVTPSARAAGARTSMRRHFELLERTSFTTVISKRDCRTGCPPFTGTCRPSDLAGVTQRLRLTTSNSFRGAKSQNNHGGRHCLGARAGMRCGSDQKNRRPRGAPASLFAIPAAHTLTSGPREAEPLEPPLGPLGFGLRGTVRLRVPGSFSGFGVTGPSTYSKPIFS